MTSNPAPHRITIMDVAHAAQVSRQTVSNVVNRPERVREDTRSRVQAEIDRLGYRPSIAAQSLRAQRAGAVGIELNALGPGRASDVLYPFLVQLVIAAPRYGSHIVPFASQDDTPLISGYESMTRAHLVDAFVVADTHAGDPRPAFLQSAGVPYAAFGRIWDDESFTMWADVDGAAGTSAAVDHLAAAGYHTIGFLGWPRGSEMGDLRRAGWVAALQRTGLAGAEFHAEAAQDVTEAFEAALPLVSSMQPGAALVCATDVLAVGALKAAQVVGLQVGRDLGIVGFDDSVTAQMHGLTTLRQPLGEIADCLLAMLAVPHTAPENGRLFIPELITRASTDRSA